MSSPARLEDYAVDFNYITPGAGAAAELASRAGRMIASAGPPKKGVVNKNLTRHGSDTTTAFARNLMEAFDHMLENEFAAEEEAELVADMDIAERDRAPTWWACVRMGHY